MPLLRHAVIAALFVAILLPAPGVAQDPVRTVSGATQEPVSETRSLCSGIRNDIVALQDRMPFWIDFVTILIGMSVFYHDGTCRLILEYLMDDTGIIEGIRKEWRDSAAEPKSAEDMVAFLNSEKGHGLLQQELKSVLSENPIFSVLLRNPGFEIGAVYRFSDDRINLITVQLPD